MANYGNSRCWRIEDIEFDKPIDEFKIDETQTLAEYYKNRYSITIKKLKQPLLRAEDVFYLTNLEKTREIYLFDPRALSNDWIIG